SMWRLGCCRLYIVFFFSSRRRHTRSKRDWSSDVCSSDLNPRHPHTPNRFSTRATATGTPQGCIRRKHSGKAAPIESGPADKRRRSEERRVGKECRSRWLTDPQNKKTTKECNVVSNDTDKF